MWIVKGILLGTLAFVVGSIIYVLAMIEMGTARATGTTALQRMDRSEPLVLDRIRGHADTRLRPGQALAASRKSVTN
jgi:hypothetical protein